MRTRTNQSALIFPHKNKIITKETINQSINQSMLMTSVIKIIGAYLYAKHKIRCYLLCDFSNALRLLSINILTSIRIRMNPFIGISFPSEQWLI